MRGGPGNVSVAGQGDRLGSHLTKVHPTDRGRLRVDGRCRRACGVRRHPQQRAQTRVVRRARRTTRAGTVEPVASPSLSSPGGRT
jgi:hypothetical protein